MSLKEDFKKALTDAGVIGDWGYERYGFQNVEGWPEIDFVKEDYENYQKHPEEYDFIKEGVSFDDFIEATVGHEMYEPGDKEELDCENVGFIKFEVSDNKIELGLHVGGDWQPPYLIKITFENNKLSAENLGRAPSDTKISYDLEKEFLSYIGLKED
jgi:hypothetical protein